MFVESAQNFEVLKEINFSLFGMGPKYRRRAERMKPDDRVLFYVKGLRKWPASATIASTYFEDNSPLWSPTTRNESFQYRVKLRADIVLDEEDYIDALLLAPQLEYIKRWVPEDWPLAFWDRLHLLPQTDFRLIEGEMQRIASNKGPVPGDDGRDGIPSEVDDEGRLDEELARVQEPSVRADDAEGDGGPEAETATRPDEGPSEPDRVSRRVDDDDEPEVVSYPAARPDAGQGQPDRPLSRVDDDDGEPEVVSYPAAQPDAGQAEPDRPSGRADDDDGEPEVVSYPAAQPNAGRGEPDRPSGRVDDDDDEPEVVSYPFARFGEGQQGPSRRVDDDDDEPEVISYPAAQPDEWQGRPGYPAARRHEGQQAQGRPSERVEDDEDEADSDAPGETVDERSEEP